MGMTPALLQARARLRSTTTIAEGSAEFTQVMAQLGSNPLFTLQEGGSPIPDDAENGDPGSPEPKT